MPASAETNAWAKIGKLLLALPIGFFLFTALLWSVILTGDHTPIPALLVPIGIVIMLVQLPYWRLPPFTSIGTRILIGVVLIPIFFAGFAFTREQVSRYPLIGILALALLAFWLWKRHRAKALQKAMANAKLAEAQACGIPFGDWPEALIDACSIISSNRYYVGDLIPDNKRIAAVINYPLPGEAEILALIDGTLFGSANNGFAIGRDGVSWKDLCSRKEHLRWSDFSRQEVTSNGHDIFIGPLCYRGISGVPFEKIRLLVETLHEYSKHISDRRHHISQIYGKSKIFSEDNSIKYETTKAESSISINESSFEDLILLPGIGAAEAQMIIKRRSKQAFISNVELIDFLDLKPHIATKLDGLTVFEPTSPASQVPVAELTPVVSNVPKPNPLGGRTID